MKKFLILFFAVFGLLSMVTGIAFAYFMLANSVNELETDVTAALIADVEFEGGQEVVVPEHGIYPGWIGVQTFHVNKPDGYTSGIGTYQIQMETTIASEFQDWITIELYKTTTPITNNIVRTEGDIVSSPDNSLEIFVKDSVAYNGFIEDTDCILKDELVYDTPKYVIDSTTGTITIEVEDFNISTMEDTTYYVVYRFTNEDENQNGAQGANFKTKIVINRGGINPDDSNYKDTVLAGNDPVLDSKMIPVTIATDGTVTKADTKLEWYDYTNSEWANAVITDDAYFLTADPGTVIPMLNIEQMYVWIPRFEYDRSTIEDATKPIDISFVNTNIVSSYAEIESDSYDYDIKVHPAFKWGTNDDDAIELPGLWVGKFEQAEDNRIIPGVNSSNNKNVLTFNTEIKAVETTYALDDTTDVHMIKNTDWGAIAYLSQSLYGICKDVDGTVICNKVENNNYWSGTTEGEIAYDITTGCGGTDTAVVGTCPDTNTWKTPNGIKASTTHNITGVYDMAGGRWEFTMGVMHSDVNNTPEVMLWLDSGYSVSDKPDLKYYDSYDYGTNYLESTRGLYGDATKELYLYPNNTIKTPTPNWNGDNVNEFVYNGYPWFSRGGGAYRGSFSGVFSISYGSGAAFFTYSSRSVAITELPSVTP